MADLSGMNSREMQEIMNMAREFFRDSRRVSGEISKATKDAARSTGEQKEAGVSLLSAARGMGTFLTDVQRSPLQALLRTGGGLAGAAASALPGGLGKLGGAVAGIGGAVGMPLIQLMLQGLQQAEQFRVNTERTLRVLDVSVGGQRWRAESKQVRADIEAMYAKWGSMGQEIGASLQQFAKSGAGMQAFEKVASSIGESTTSVVEFSTALDYLKGAGPGTTAGALVEGFISTGKSAGFAAAEIGKLARYAESTDTNYEALLQTMVQGTTAFRTQKVALSDIADVYSRVRGGMGETFLQGMRPEAQGARSITAMQGLMGAMQNTGAWRIRFAQSLAPGADPLTAIGRLNIGSVPEGQNILLAQIQFMRSEFDRVTAGKTMEQRAGILTTTGFGPMGPMTGEVAQAFLSFKEGGKITKEQLEKMRKELNPQTIADLLKEGTQRQSRTADSMDRLLREFMLAVSQIGLGIVGSLVGLGYLIKGVMGDPADRTKGMAILGGSVRAMGRGVMGIGGVMGESLDFALATVDESMSRVPIEDLEEAAVLSSAARRNIVGSLRARFNAKLGKPVSDEQVWSALPADAKKTVDTIVELVRQEALAPGKLPGERYEKLVAAATDPNALASILPPRFTLRKPKVNVTIPGFGAAELEITVIVKPPKSVPEPALSVP